MAQWPFAHEYEMTYRLSDGVFEVRTTVSNLSDETMPLAIGFHPFFQIPGIPRDEWMAHYPARIHVIADEHNIPTGEMRPLDLRIRCRYGAISSTTALRTWSATPTAARTSGSKRAVKKWKRCSVPSIQW